MPRILTSAMELERLRFGFFVLSARKWFVRQE
jgi:hypothetical protein